MELQEELPHLLASIEEAIIPPFQQQLDAHKVFLDDFIHNTEQFLDQLNAADSMKGTPVWEYLDSYNKQTIHFIEPLNTFPGDLAGDAAREQFDRFAGEQLQNVPDRIELIVPDTFWDFGKNDTTTIRIRKKAVRIVKKLNRFATGTINRALRLTGRTEIVMPPATRTVQVHDLLAMFVFLPYRRFARDQWQAFFMLKARHAYILHDYCDSVKNMLIQNFRPDDQRSIRKLTEQMRTSYQQLSTNLTEETTQFQLDLTDSIVQQSHLISEDIKRRWEVAGTFILPGDAYSGRMVEKKNKAFIASAKRTVRGWGKHFGCEHDEWRKDIDLAAIEIASILQTIHATETVRESIQHTIIPILEESRQSIEKTAETIMHSNQPGNTGITESVIEECREVVQTQRKKNIPRMLEALHTAHIEQVLREYREAICRSTDGINKSYRIFTVRDFDHLPPQSHIEQVPFHDIVNEEFIPQFDATCGELERDIHERIETSLRSITDIDQILEFNIEAALKKSVEIKKESDEDSFNILVDGLTRTQSHIAGLIDVFLEITDETGTRLMDVTAELNRHIQQTADNEKVLELQISLASARTRKRIQQYRNNFGQMVHSALPVASRYGKTAIARIFALYRRFRKITRLEPVSGRFDEKIGRFLAETRQKIGRLPYVYQQLFSLDPISDRRFFAGEEDELTMLRQSYEKWREDRNETVVIIGERGSGKTTFLNIVQSEILTDIPVIRIGLHTAAWEEHQLLQVLAHGFGRDDADSLNALEASILQAAEPCVCMLENIHHSYLRTVTGFDSVERLLLFMQNTRDTVFWIMSSALYGWQYLEKVISISSYFQSVIELGTQSCDQMKNIIMSRHRMSGYRIVYEIPDDMRANRQFKKIRKESDRQVFIEQQLFEHLSDMSSGNIRVAMLFWLTAIKEIDKEQIVIASEIELDHAFIYQLPSEELFTLASLIQHEALDEYQHSLVFRQNIIQSTLLLKKMLSRGLLQHQETGYHVHPFLYRPVVEALRSKQMLQ